MVGRSLRSLVRAASASDDGTVPEAPEAGLDAETQLLSKETDEDAAPPPLSRHIHLLLGLLALASSFAVLLLGRPLLASHLGLQAAGVDGLLQAVKKSKKEPQHTGKLELSFKKGADVAEFKGENRDVQCETIGKDGVGARHTCVFPFMYYGMYHAQCTRTDHHELWCPTQVDVDNSIVPGQWGACSSKCRAMYEETPAGTDECPDDFVDIPDAEECEDAGTILGLSWRGFVDWPDSPSGCGFLVTNKVEARWNRDKHGTRHVDDGNICKFAPKQPEEPEDGDFISSLNLPKDCTGRGRQTSFPFSWGTVTATHVIRPTDPTAYQDDIENDGRGKPLTGSWWDWRKGDWISKFETTKEPLRFKCSFKFASGKRYHVKIEANPDDFKTFTAAKKYIDPYLKALGRVPELLFSNVKILTVGLGGGESSKMGADFMHGQITMNWNDDDMDRLSETFFHEGVHLSLDPVIKEGGYERVVYKDCHDFYSSYAAQHFKTEGVAESFLPYWALRYRMDRLTETQIKDITDIGPNRMKLFHDYVVRNKLEHILAPP